jgi:predicted GH43/DUF377 family glycosyl hydrolase
MNIIEFEKTLFDWRMEKYRHHKPDMINEGFRPVSGRVADFGGIWHNDEYHVFYIERRVQEGTPFYPGNEIYFGHASTKDFFEWEVHNPVMLIVPNTWEEAHVWAPFVFRWKGRFVMAYTGLNYHCSQNIGLAFSDDLFNWERWEGNPISPAKDRPWSWWREDHISSCRDPHVLEHDGRVWMVYTANTHEGATCLAVTSTTDLEKWEDHGPIIVGPSEGYEPRLEGGHPQGSMESSNLLTRRGKWFLTCTFKARDSDIRDWLFESDNLLGPFKWGAGWEFWPGAIGVEVVKDHDDKSLLCCFSACKIRFGEVDWSKDKPTAQFIPTEERLKEWRRL